MTRRIPASALLLFAVIAASCGEPTGRMCGNWSDLTLGYGLDVTMAPGARAVIPATMQTAAAYMDEAGTCETVTYDSRQRPAAFRWASSDTSIAAMAGDTIIARALGTAWVRVLSADQVDSTRVIVKTP